MSNLENKNTVASKNQVNKHVFFEGVNNGTPRIMFVGNSITWHKPAPDIGWHGDWGMAASTREKDWVHLCMSYIQGKYPEASFCIVQAAEWERGYMECDISSVFFEACQFKPDIIVTRLSENISVEYMERYSLVSAMQKFHEYLSGNNEQVKLIVTSNVFGNKLKDVPLKEYSELMGAEYVYLNDYKEDSTNFANEFEHEGVRMHPGDKGMELIAGRVITALNKVL